MAASSASPTDDDRAQTVVYGTADFDRSTTALAETAPPDTGACIVFHDGSREERQQALTSLTRHATGSVHQFRMPALLSERRMQTQNALRKSFDHAAEEGALLYFDAADALFTHVHEDTLDGEGDAEPTAIEYFFDRIEAYREPIVLALQTVAHVDAARARGSHLVVRFKETH